VHWRSYPHYRRVIQRTFIWGILIIGLYGLLQFLYLPAWDSYWLEASASVGGSMGPSEAGKVRIFSTLNSPGPFAVVMMAGLLLLWSGRSPLRWPAAGVGLIGFLLTLVRSAWGAWVLGLIFMAVRLRRSSPRLLVGLAVVGVTAWPLLTVGPVAGAVETRLQTLTNLQQDTSANSRLDFYEGFASRAFFNPVGEGLGSTGLATRLGADTGEQSEFTNFDSGIMNIPFVLGWPGSLLYIGGLAWLLLRALRSGGPRSDLFVVSAQGIVVAMLVQLVFANALVGLGGLIFWSFLGLALAASVYNASVANIAAKPRVPTNANNEHFLKEVKR